MLATEIILIGLGVAIALIAVQWIRSRPAGDPALDRLLLVISPLLWLIRRNHR